MTLLAFGVASGALITYFGDNSSVIDTAKSLLLSPWLWAIAVICVVGLWWLLCRKTGNRVISRLQKAFRELWAGFAVIVKMPGKGRWFEWTLCVWGCYFTQMLIAFMAFPATEGVIGTHGLGAVLVVFALSSISMGVPSNGGIGPWQWAVIFGLGIYGVENATAGAFANVVLGSQTLLQIILGIFTFIMIALDKRRKKSKNTNIEQCQK